MNEQVTMAQRLEVNNKTYLPSVVLAKEFGYTSDYISKLAREEKILGTRVGRQWFVEPESLKIFIAQLEVEKRIIKEDLSLERKRERQRSVQKNVTGPYEPEPAVITGGKSLAVVMCGFIVGCLALFGHTYGLQTADLLSGSVYLKQQFHERVFSGLLALVPTTLIPADTVANAVLSDQPDTMQEDESVQPVGTYTIFPEVIATTSKVTSNDSEVMIGDRTVEKEESPTIQQLPFSDEVTLETSHDGSLRVRPVFKDTEGQLYEVTVEAVTNAE